MPACRRAGVELKTDSAIAPRRMNHMSNTAFNTDTLAEWNLSAVPQVIQDSVRAAIENRDGASFIGYVDRGSQLIFCVRIC